VPFVFFKNDVSWKTLPFFVKFYFGPIYLLTTALPCALCSVYSAKKGNPVVGGGDVMEPPL
jgi:hypothetical protein